MAPSHSTAYLYFPMLNPMREPRCDGEDFAGPRRTTVAESEAHNRVNRRGEERGNSLTPLEGWSGRAAATRDNPCEDLLVRRMSLLQFERAFASCAGIDLCRR